MKVPILSRVLRSIAALGYQNRPASGSVWAISSMGQGNSEIGRPPRRGHRIRPWRPCRLTVAMLSVCCLGLGGSTCWFWNRMDTRLIRAEQAMALMDRTDSDADVMGGMLVMMESSVRTIRRLQELSHRNDAVGRNAAAGLAKLREALK